MIGRVNVGGGGRGTADAFAYVHVSYPSGYVCTATNGSITLTAPNTSGSVVFAIPEPSSLPETWTFACTDGSHNKSGTVTITAQYQFEQLTFRYSRLPDGYQEVEYLQSSGTQYINTGLSIPYSGNTWGTQFEITFMMLSDVTHAVGGVVYSTTKILLGFPAVLNNTALYVYGSQNVSGAPTPVVNTKYTVLLNNSSHQLIINNSVIGTYTTSSTVNGAADVYLFGAHNAYGSGIVSQRGSTRIYEYKRTINSTGVVEQHLIPCYRTSDNVAGMIDLVGGTFYTNAGTGTFAVGADV